MIEHDLRDDSLTYTHRLSSVLNRIRVRFTEYRRILAGRVARRRRRVAGSRRLGKLGVLLALLLMATLSSIAMVASPFPPLQPHLINGENSLKAVLIDSLSLTDPDPLFISNVTHSLSVAGYTVDYYGPSHVTVDLFRNLALQNYKIVIIRSHTATVQGIPTSLSIVTSEPYSNLKYAYQQLIGQVAPAIVRPGNTFFAITPAFIRDAIQGSLRDALVVQMGCGTLTGNREIAMAFIGKGASAFVGWNNTVSSWYTDLATQKFVSSLEHGQTVPEAVVSAGGPDPVYGGNLGSLEPPATAQDQFNIRMTTILGSMIILSVTLLAAGKLFRADKVQSRSKKRIQTS
ncbi:hypothetical protein AUF78_13800 [archaeon 13_1_20CM_2_51_12]|nr:MAG: hypothetical protein AUF78_13800 [archaeon 13_1_20CM_2_51_12]